MSTENRGPNINESDVRAATERFKQWVSTLPESEQRVFGWILTRAAAADPGEATRYGLQAAIFSTDLPTCLEAARRLEFGGVIVNEAPTFRADQMPYGGVKASGNTKEGPAWAVREMTEERLVVLGL